MRAAALLLLFACGSAPPAPPAPVARGVLVVRCSVPDALLVVDEQAVGELRHLAAGVRLSAGTHRVELRRDGFHPRYAEVAVAAGGTRTLELTLVEAYP
jgi:hypothetical protein